MSTPFPCPNPACSYRFDPALLPPAAMVTCPLCHARFPYRAAPTAPGAPAPPPQYAQNYGYPQAPSSAPGWPSAPAPAWGQAPPPPASYPQPAPAPYPQPAPAAAYPQQFQGGYPAQLAPPAPYPAGAYAPVPQQDQQPAKPAGPRLVNSRYAPKGNRQTYLFLGLFTAFIAVGLFIVYSVTQKSPWDTTPNTTQNVKEFNFAYQVPERWNNDTDARDGLKLNTFALKRVGIDAWVGMYVQDFKDRNPRPAELRVIMREKLLRYFSNVELAEQAETKWAGQKSAHFMFTGENNQTLMNGECHFMSFGGLGYIFFAWAPAESFGDALKEFQAMRERFRFLDERANWAPQKASTTVFTSRDGPFEIEDSDGVWKARLPAGEDQDSKTADKFAADPKELDPDAAIALIARYPIKNAKARGIDFIPMAQGLVVVMPKQGGDLLATAKQRILDRTKKVDPEAEVEIEEVKESPSETAMPTDGVTMTRFQLRYPKNRDGTQYYVVSAITVGDKLVVLETWCQNGGRSTRFAQYMEPFMIKLAASLKAK